MATKKSFWAFVSGLDEAVLLKQGEELELKTIYPPEPTIAKKEEKEIFKSKKDRETVDEDWLSEEAFGQLSIDLYEEESCLVIESTIAGVKPEDIDITVEPDLITIRGERKKTSKVPVKNYFYQECFWGKFSRTLVLPSPVEPEGVRAEIKNGVLKIVLPKAAETATVLKPK